jgi:hypothetical protein
MQEETFAMSDSIHSNKRARALATRAAPDPLFKAIVFDLLVTTSGFVLIVAAVVLAARDLSLH